MWTAGLQCDFPMPLRLQAVLADTHLLTIMRLLIVHRPHGGACMRA